MSDLSSFEAVETMIMLEASIDVQFQLWITLTFAAIASSYLARDVLSLKFAHFMAAVYLLSTTAVGLRWLTELHRISKLGDEFEAVRDTFPPWGGVMVVSTTAMFFVGVCGCVFCIYYFCNSKGGT